MADYPFIKKALLSAALVSQAVSLYAADLPSLKRPHGLVSPAKVYSKPKLPKIGPRKAAKVQSPLANELVTATWSAYATNSNARIAPKTCTTTPVVLIDEDFTDGKFDNIGAGTDAVNWRIYNDAGLDFKSVGFFAPNNRSFTTSFARIPYQAPPGSSKWAGAQWAVYKDPNTPKGAPLTDKNLVKFKVDKNDDVCVVKYKVFSDIARGQEEFGVEVAMLEYADTLCPPPDYCHDLSFEAEQKFSTKTQVQLFGNTENTGPPNIPGVTATHYRGAITADVMNREFQNLVIWRNMPGTGKSNIEQRGELNDADFTVNEEMKSKLDPGSPFSEFSYMQIGLFHGSLHTTSTSPMILRNGVDVKDAQIGIMSLHLGITKRSDFNIDYVIDNKDADILIKNMGRTDSTLLLHGDATNDNKIDINDANQVTGFWSQQTQGNPSFKATYNKSTGEVKITADGISFFKVSAPAGVFSGTKADFSKLNASASTSVDTLIGAFSTATWKASDVSLGNILLPQLSGSALDNIKITVNYQGSCIANGFDVKFDDLFVDTISTSINEELLGKTITIDNQKVKLSANDKDLKVRIYNTQGLLLWEKEGAATQLDGQKPALQSVTKLLQIINQRTGKVITNRKYISQ